MAMETKSEDQEGCEPETTPPTVGTGPSPKCVPLPEGEKPPKLDDPKPCPSKCNCPATPPATQTCFDTLIEGQAKLVNEAEQAKTFKAELEELLKQAKAAKLAFTRVKFMDFSKRWDALDKEIVSVIEFVTCNVKCWECVVECEICQLLNTIHEIELKLDGPGTLIGTAYSQEDLHYWHSRNAAQKEVAFLRIKGVLAAWSDPAKTIETNLAANEKLVKALRSMDPAEALLKLFMVLIPLHLAIAPRPITTGIAEKYRELCNCYPGVPDDCCGPDVGIPSSRQRLVSPQAYIVDPDNFFEILCCLATERYLPAKNQLTSAKSDLAAVEVMIARLRADLERRKNSFIEDYLANVLSPIDCKNYTSKDGDDCDDTEQSSSPVVR